MLVAVAVAVEGLLGPQAARVTQVQMVLQVPQVAQARVPLRVARVAPATRAEQVLTGPLVTQGLQATPEQALLQVARAALRLLYGLVRMV